MTKCCLLNICCRVCATISMDRSTHSLSPCYRGILSQLFQVSAILTHFAKYQTVYSKLMGHLGSLHVLYNIFHKIPMSSRSVLGLWNVKMKEPMPDFSSPELSDHSLFCRQPTDTSVIRFIGCVSVCVWLYAHEEPYRSIVVAHICNPFGFNWWRTHVVRGVRIAAPSCQWLSHTVAMGTRWH